MAQELIFVVIIMLERAVDSDPAAAVATTRVQVTSELDDLLAQLRKRAASHCPLVANGGT